MVSRALEKTMIRALSSFPALAILGARQVGKTTLAKQLSGELKKQSITLTWSDPAHWPLSSASLKNTLLPT